MRRWQRELDMADDRDMGERIPNPLYESQPITLAEQCPRCGREKHADNAVCDACGDVVGCAYCGGTKQVRDEAQSLVPCPECASADLSVMLQISVNRSLMERLDDVERRLTLLESR